MRSKGAWDLLSLAGGGESGDGTTFPRVGLRGLGPLPCASELWDRYSTEEGDQRALATPCLQATPAPIERCALQV